MTKRAPRRPIKGRTPSLGLYIAQCVAWFFLLLIGSYLTWIVGYAVYMTATATY